MVLVLNSYFLLSIDSQLQLATRFSNLLPTSFNTDPSKISTSKKVVFCAAGSFKNSSHAIQRLRLTTDYNNCSPWPNSLKRLTETLTLLKLFFVGKTIVPKIMYHIDCQLLKLSKVKFPLVFFILFSLHWNFIDHNKKPQMIGFCRQEFRSSYENYLRGCYW